MFSAHSAVKSYMFMTVFYKNTILFRLVKSGTNEVSTYTKNVEREKLVESSMQLLGW